MKPIRKFLNKSVYSSMIPNFIKDVFAKIWQKFNLFPLFVAYLIIREFGEIIFNLKFGITLLFIRLGFKYYFTPFSAKILPHSWRCEAAVYQILGKCPRQRRHCSNANITRLLSKIWSSILIGFDRSHAMYFCQISTYYETILWRTIPWNTWQNT